MNTSLLAFLNHHVENYLLEDIATMQPLRPSPGKHAGGVGYPLLMTVVAGIELLGGLLSQHPFDRHAGRKYFSEYWRAYLYPGDPLRSAIGDELYQLVRHGLAHAFLTKGHRILTTKSCSEHLVQLPTGEVIVDAVQMASDFANSYWSRVAPVASSPTHAGQVNAQTMTARLAEMLADYSTQAAQNWSAFGSLPMARPEQLDGQGASGSAMPLPR